jgi:hypothetical protein
MTWPQEEVIVKGVLPPKFILFTIFFEKKGCQYTTEVANIVGCKGASMMC